MVEHDGLRLELGYQTVESGMTLGLAVDHGLDVPSHHDVSLHADADVGVRSGVVVEPDVCVRLFKYAAYQTSRSVDASELVERCRRTLDRVVGAGFESLVAAQRSNLDRFWERGRDARGH